MTYSDLSEFVFRFALGIPSASAWIWSIITVIAFITILGSFWGRAWNRDWNLTRNGGYMITMLIFAAMAGYSVFNLRSIARMDDWFKMQRSILSHSISESKRFKRSVLVETWNRIEAKQGQEGLTPPDQSGDQVRLGSPEDAMVLASIAAEEARSSLRAKPPFIYGVALDTKSPDEIATETADALNVGPAAYPRMVSSDNEWSATAATLQANHAIDTAYSVLKPRLADLETACTWLLGSLVLISAILGAFRALDGIKVNPGINSEQ